MAVGAEDSHLGLERMAGVMAANKDLGNIPTVQVASRLRASAPGVEVEGPVPLSQPR